MAVRRGQYGNEREPADVGEGRCGRSDMLNEDARESESEGASPLCDEAEGGVHAPLQDIRDERETVTGLHRAEHSRYGTVRAATNPACAGERVSASTSKGKAICDTCVPITFSFARTRAARSRGSSTGEREPVLPSLPSGHLSMFVQWV